MENEEGEAEVLYNINYEESVMIIYHTFVPDILRGQGIAEKLTRYALGIAKSRKLLIKPDCEYVKKFFEKHKEFEDLLYKI
ncbi:MAG: GNAT family N-acetyltransferase [Candidatus Micrarchaeaceae archaeon]